MKYWAYVNNEILGPFEKEKLLELPTFSPSLLVCPQTPVGEKTEDWKEAATYPELSALIASGSGLSHAAPAASQPAPAPQPAAQPAAQAEPAAHGFKSLTASSIDPVPPSDHGMAGVNISVNKLGKAHGAQEPAAENKQASAFDPISLSTIVRRTETLSGEPREDEIAKEPHQAFPQPSPEPSAPMAGLEISAITRQNEPAAQPAPAPAPAPVLEQFPSAASPAAEPPPYTPAPEAAPAAQASAGPAMDTAALSALVSRLDAISKAAATRQDLASSVEPLRMKLDQMGEVLSSMKNSQFQREIMDKFNYLENAIGEMRAALKTMQSAPPPAARQEPVTMRMEKPAEVFMGVQPPAKETPKPEAAKETAKPAEIVDTGSKSSKIGPALKKAAKAIVTIVLLIAVLLGAVIGLKTFGIFDATKFIPFPLPFIGGAEQAAPAAPQAEQQPGGEAQQPAAQGEQPAAQQTPQAQQQGTPQEQAQAQTQAQAPKEPDHSPEVIYFTRTFKLKPAGPSLEDKIYEHAAKAGGDYNRTTWQVKLSGGGLYEITAVIPSKAGDLRYSFAVNYDQKNLVPVDDSSKAAYELFMASTAQVKAGRKKPGRKPAAKQPSRKGSAVTTTTSAAPAAKPAKAAKAPKASEDEYEYVYEEDDGTGQ